MAKKQFKKPLFRTRKPSTCSLPAGSSQALAGDLASDSQTLWDGSQRTFARIKDFLHPSWVAPVKSCQGSTAEPDLDPLSVESQVDAAQLALDVMTTIHPRMGRTAVDYVARANTSIADIQSLSNTYLYHFKIFNSVVVTIANVHPYAQVALGILIAASQLILTQSSLDDAISVLLKKLSIVYKVLSEEDTLKNLDDMRDTLAKIARVVSDAAQFVTNYSETKSFWKRLGKSVLSETQSVVDGYVETLDDLMQQYRDCIVRDIQINVYRVLEDVNLEGMAYAAGAGLDTTKRCLDGTRTEILQQIVSWATDLDVNAPRILWLRGQAGRGKSTIAHTVASWIKDVGGLGSCFCFAHDRQAERREQKIFTTIARGLADRDPAFRRALADAVSRDYDLKTTSDVVQQWQQLILGPLSKVDGMIVGNVIVVIDALDESGPETSRRQILSLLTSTEANHLPTNFRILLTSRPLPDIEHALGTCPHVKPTSLDNISAELTERDIRLYVSTQLGHLREMGAIEVQTIVQKSDGLFEWARLACEFIKPSKPGRTVRERYDEVVYLGSGGGGAPLDVTYRTILEDTIPDDNTTLARFCFVMRQIMGAFEPLGMDAANKICTHFPRKEDHWTWPLSLDSCL